MEYSVKIVGGQSTIARIRKLAGTPQQRHVFFERAGTYMRKVTGETFRTLRWGGTYRGVTWPYFKFQRIRKTDGKIIPAWGGVPRLDREKYAGTKGARMSEMGSWSTHTLGRPGRSATPYKRGTRSTLNEPLVRGRLRPSGKRLQDGDVLMQDTRTMHNSVVVNWGIARVTDRKAEFGTGLRYAAKQQAMRAYLFFERGVDSKRLIRIYHQTLKEMLNDGRA